MKKIILLAIVGIIAGCSSNPIGGPERCNKVEVSITFGGFEETFVFVDDVCIDIATSQSTNTYMVCDGSTIKVIWIIQGKKNEYTKTASDGLSWFVMEETHGN